MGSNEDASQVPPRLANFKHEYTLQHSVALITSDQCVLFVHVMQRNPSYIACYNPIYREMEIWAPKIE